MSPKTISSVESVDPKSLFKENRKRVIDVDHAVVSVLSAIALHARHIFSLSTFVSYCAIRAPS